MSYIIKIAIQQAVKKQNCFVVFTSVVARSESVSLPMSGKVARVARRMRRVINRFSRQRKSSLVPRIPGRWRAYGFGMLGVKARKRYITANPARIFTICMNICIIMHGDMYHMHVCPAYMREILHIINKYSLHPLTNRIFDV